MLIFRGTQTTLVRALQPLALCTGFEPARLLHPTVFKTAPSPPGHTAKKWVQRWDSNPRRSGYEPDELTTALLCNINCEQFVNISKKSGVFSVFCHICMEMYFKGVLPNEEKNGN